MQGHPVVGYGQGVSLGTPLRTGLIAQWSSILHGACKKVVHHCLRSWAFCDGSKLGTSEWVGTGLARAWFIGKCRRNKTQARTIGETTGQNTREQHQRKGRREADRGPSTADTPAPRGRTAVMGPRAAEPLAACVRCLVCVFVLFGWHLARSRTDAHAHSTHNAPHKSQPNTYGHPSNHFRTST